MNPQIDYEAKANVERTFRRCLGGVLRKLGHSKAMSDSEVGKIGKSLLGDKFIGVFALDEIEYNTYRPTGTCYIMNNKTRRSYGEHWLAVWHNQNQTPILFDSFARRYIIPDFQGEMTELDVDQQDWQESCGQRCIAFLCVAASLGDACYWV